MAQCDVCGNDYHTPLEIRQGGRTGTFDSFECAIQAFAPLCGNCGTRVVGHGTERGGQVFCSRGCAERAA